MSNSKLDFFEKYKIDKFEKIDHSNINNNIYFQLNFDLDKRAYIKVVDIDDNEIDIRALERKKDSELVKEILKITEKKYLTFNWLNKDYNKIYLDENESLLEKLESANYFVDTNFRKITFDTEKSKIRLTIEGESILATTLSLYNGLETLIHFIPLSEKYFYANARIYKTESIGKNFSNIKDLEINLKSNQLEKYLSILYSNFEQLHIFYKDYDVVIGEDKTVSPVLSIEKIDKDKNLNIKILKSISNTDYKLFQDYDISKYAFVNDELKTIFVSKILEKNKEFYIEDFERLLSKYKKQYTIKNNVFYIDDTFIIEENVAKDIIYKELPVLGSKYNVIGTENLSEMKVKTIKPKLHLSLSHGIDFLEGSGEVELEGEFFSIHDFIDNYNKNTNIILKDGTNAIINKSYMDKLKRLFKKEKNKIKVSFFDLPIIEELIDENLSPEIFKKSREILDGFNNINEIPFEKDSVKTDLRNYQEQGFKWLKYLEKNQLGGCLADDMGLGKTVQTLALLSSIYPEKQDIPSLIVMPKSLLFNWENEIRKFTPNITYYSFYGQNRDIKEAKTKNLILTTYSMLRNESDKFREEDFYYVVLDESQNIKTSTSQISRAVMHLKAKYKLALSGTPFENNLGELFSLFRFLNSSMFGTIDDFNKNYAYPIQKENNKEVTQELKRKIYPFILRRLKKDVLKELPEKIEQTIFVEMSPEQKEFYEQRRNFYYKSIREQISSSGISKSQFYILQALNELRQIASIPESKTDDTIISPKREILIENILEVISNKHKVLVFGNFLNVVDKISKDLEKEGIKHLTMTGSTTNRAEIVEKFQNDPEYKVFVMTLKTGGLGLNLTAADYIFIFDPWWNKAAENQAIDRAHRIGQDKTVFSYKLITKDTIEEKILQLQEKKIELFDTIISSDDASIKSLTEDDFEYILGK
ncbi:MAG: DEAD/DEAH box helicase [Candidatus Sericytochromatia bacterium]